ncbi:hypothetical protein B0H14DRAFT_2359250, partial [Mycena olivaceomarginata]
FRRDGSRRKPIPYVMHGWLAKMRRTLLGNEELPYSTTSSLFHPFRKFLPTGNAGDAGCSTLQTVEKFATKT